MKITRFLSRFNTLPFLLRLGLAVFAVGGLFDLLFHSAPASWGQAMDLYLGRDGRFAHLITFLGMGLTMIGVLIEGVRDHKERPSESGPFSNIGGAVWSNDDIFTRTSRR